MKPTTRYFVFLFFAVLLIVLPSLWAGARKVHVQGKLTDSAGAPLTGVQTVTFKLYDAATGGAMVWTSGAMSVTPTSGGLFNVPLQDGTPSLDGVSFDKAFYLGITVGADAEMTPRQELGASALSHGSAGDFQVKNNLIVSNGKLGIGTASPSSPVNIVAPAIQMTVEGTVNQSVQIEMIDRQSNAKKWRFVSGMNNRGGLQFYQATNNIEAVEISPTGNVGIGTVIPNDKLDIGGNIRLSSGNKSILFSDPGNYDFSIVHNGGASLDIFSPEYNASVPIASFFNNGNVGIGTRNPSVKLEVMGDAKFNGVFYASDRSLKKNIHALPLDTLDRVVHLNGVGYNWDVDAFKRKYAKAAGSKKGDVLSSKSSEQEIFISTAPQIGLVAQEVEAQFPELVHTGPDGVKSVDYGKFTAVLLEAVKSLQKQVVDTQKELTQLKKIVK